MDGSIAVEIFSRREGPVAKDIIKSSDEDAIERLEEKLDALKRKPGKNESCQ